MRIRMLVNLGSRDYPDLPFLDGETYEVSDEVGNHLVGRKLAVVAVEPPQAKPETPASNEPESKPTAKPAVSNSKGK